MCRSGREVGCRHRQTWWMTAASTRKPVRKPGLCRLQRADGEPSGECRWLHEKDMQTIAISTQLSRPAMAISTFLSPSRADYLEGVHTTLFYQLFADESSPVCSTFPTTIVMSLSGWRYSPATRSRSRTVIDSMIVRYRVA